MFLFRRPAYEKAASDLLLAGGYEKRADDNSRGSTLGSKYVKTREC